MKNAKETAENDGITKNLNIVVQFNDTNEDIISICVLRHLKKNRSVWEKKNGKISVLMLIIHLVADAVVMRIDVLFAAHYFRELEMITLFCGIEIRNGNRNE